MLRTLLALVVVSSVGCDNPLDVYVAFSRVPCSSRVTCEVAVQTWLTLHPEQHVIALDFQASPQPSIAITHGSFGSKPAHSLVVTSTLSPSQTEWQLRVSKDVKAARVPVERAMAAR